MERQTQALVAGMIFGAISLLMTACASTAWYGAFNGGAPALAPIGGLFTLFAIGTAAAAVCALQSGKGC